MAKARDRMARAWHDRWSNPRWKKRLWWKVPSLMVGAYFWWTGQSGEGLSKKLAEAGWWGFFETGAFRTLLTLVGVVVVAVMVVVLLRPAQPSEAAPQTTDPLGARETIPPTAPRSRQTVPNRLGGPLPPEEPLSPLEELAEQRAKEHAEGKHRKVSGQSPGEWNEAGTPERTFSYRQSGHSVELRLRPIPELTFGQALRCEVEEPGGKLMWITPADDATSGISALVFYPFENSPPLVDGEYIVRWRRIGGLLNIPSMMGSGTVAQGSFRIKDKRLVY
jgi:hypothetical protein